MKKILAAVLCTTVFATTALAQGNEFKVRYVGGSLPSTVKPDDWGNAITESPEMIVVKLKDGQTINVDEKQQKKTN